MQRQEKVCRSCNETKADTDFSKKRNGKDSICKGCKNKKRRQLYRKRKGGKLNYELKQITGIREIFVNDPVQRAEAYRVLEEIFSKLAVDIWSEDVEN